MAAQQAQVIAESSKFEACPVCGKKFTHSSYLDHLFKNKECMRKFWKEEEKEHVFRLRHRAIKNIVT